MRLLTTPCGFPQVLKGYKDAYVNYVEFSVGWGDLITRPALFQAMMQGVHPDGTYDVPKYYNPLRQRLIGGVKFRFLAGFPRDLVSFPNLLLLDDPSVSVDEVEVTYVRSTVKQHVHRKFYKSVGAEDMRKFLDTLEKLTCVLCWQCV